MTIEVRLLGPTELLEHGRPADPGPAKRRAMLAALALEANRPVSLSRLTESTWSGAPPRSAVANLRNHAAALRRVLRHRILARGGGYQLRLAPGELDVDAFRRLAAQGRRALAAVDPATAEPALAAALRLWRGAAGDGLPRGTALETQLESLDEHRLVAFEDLVDRASRSAGTSTCSATCASTSLATRYASGPGPRSCWRCTTAATREVRWRRTARPDRS
jgi:DNA-binding SARP family transcriptional activator